MSLASIWAEALTRSRSLKNPFDFTNALRVNFEVFEFLGFFLLLGILIPCFIFQSAERMLRRFYGVESSTQPAERAYLKRALQGCAAELNLTQKNGVPDLVIFADPFPRARVTRRLQGPGTLYLSRGLLSLLTEAELLAVFKASLLRLNDRGIRRATVCAAWALAMGKKSKIAAGSRVSLTPPGLVAMGLALPLYLIFKNSAQKTDILASDSRGIATPLRLNDAAWTRALRKASRIGFLHEN